MPGPFKISRNPIYLSLSLLFLSFVIWLGSLSAGLVFLLYIIVIDRRIVPREEAEQLRRNARKTSAYMERTRRWL